MHIPSCAVSVTRRASSLEPRTRESAGFTLIELLVVIAIIGILAGLLLPALNGAREAAKKSKTATLISSLGVALKAYYNEYGYWPNTSGGLSEGSELTAAYNQDLLQMLTGTDVWLGGGAGGNPKKTVFLDVKSADMGLVDNAYLKAGSGSTNLVNPWGNSIRVKFDYDGNNQVTAPFGGVNVSGGAAIWSIGGRNYSITNTSWK